MRTVEATTVPAADLDRRDGWEPDVDARLAALESPVRDLLAPRLESLAADRITIVPDVHYPFHPSTGMVTDPAVTGAAVAVLEERTDADVAVAGASDEYIDLERTAAYLGYDDLLDRFDATLVDCAAADAINTVVEIGDESLAVSVPTRLREGAVVVVPTLRPTADGPIAGGMRTLARLVDGPDESPIGPVAATRAVEPTVAVLDATTTYGGRPYAADTLFAGPPAAVDAVGTALLERSPEDDDALRVALSDDGTAVAVEGSGTDAGFDLAAMRARLPAGELPPSDETHPAVSAAYRLYAALGGDAVPPQLEGRR
ncbi:DUF362 domain-containing protein [Halopiger djelfimassiliensis]|uniref:DUF362 domain-containing protein n=1 Tax=Halopiger djelfimassiliensis TaxID=1293047 RepID=UPI000677D6DD|nr:DUF362 domain-containing protein [Halopiger djelfimassiliensis]